MAQNPIQHRDGRLVLAVWVVAGASRTEIAGIHGDALKVRLAAPATEGQANAALQSFLMRRLGCDVTIAGGASSRRKRIDIESSDLGGIAALLGIAPG